MIIPRATPGRQTEALLALSSTGRLIDASSFVPARESFEGFLLVQLASLMPQREVFRINRLFDGQCTRRRFAMLDEPWYHVQNGTTHRVDKAASMSLTAVISATY